MADKTIKIKGEFDASGILASFKKIRDEAAKSGVGDKILAGYDKELAKVEKLTTQILASAGKGLTNSNDIKEYTRLVNQLEKAYGILNVKAQGFADANNYTKENAEVRKYMNQLQSLIQKQDSLRKAAESYIDTNKKNLKLNEDEAKALKKSIADAQEYKKVVDEIVESKMKAAQQKMGAAVVKATGGQQALDEIDNRPGKFDFAAAEKKGRDSSRKALVNKNGTIKEDEAIIAANLEYNRILKETIQNGGSAEDAMAELTKTMKAYKLELTNADEVQKQFAEDIEKVYEAASQSRDNLNQGEKTALTKGMNERNAAKNLAGTLTNENVTNVQQNADQIADAENQVNQALEKRVQELEQIIGLMKSNANTVEQVSNTEIEKQKQVIAEAQKYVSVQDSIQKGFDRIGQGAKQILSVTTSWRAFRNVIKSTFNDIKDLDKAFGSIAMVTSYSVKDMWAQYDQYAAMANKLGQSTKSVVEASALYYQQGLKTNEVMQLTEETMKLATLAGLDFKEATSQMTAALRAFHMDMSEGAHVTDVYAEVAAHAAVDVQGLSEAMSACAAIANSSGMAFETTTAMLATMTEATQEAPKNLGTAMKTILARFTELKNNVAGTADSEFDDLDYNKVDKALKSVGISIKDATGQFRNMDDVLLELSGKWKGLDRNSQRYIATIAAGSRQQSRFIALMENYERTMELVNVAQNSAGRSSQQFAKYQDTVEYRLNKISNTWEQFKTNLLTSDFYKDVLDNFNGFLNKLNDTSAAGLATLAGTWLTFGRKAVGGMVSGYSNLLGNLGKPKDSTAFKEDYLHKNQSNYLDQNGILTGEAQDQLFKDADKAWEQANAKAKIKSQALGQIISTGLTTAITTGLTIDDPISAGLTAGIASAASLLPTFIQLGKTFGGKVGVGIGVGVTAAITLASMAISNFNKKQKQKEKESLSGQVKTSEELLKKSQETLDQKKDENKNTKNEIDNLKNIQEEITKLNGKVILTEEEQSKYNDLVSTLREEYPSLISQYDEETGKIRLNNDLLKERVETLSTLEKKQRYELFQEQEYNNLLEKESKSLNTKKEYSDKISGLTKLSSGQSEELQKLFLNYNGNTEDFQNSIDELIKKNDISADIQQQILIAVSDFENTYREQQKMEKKESYAELVAQIRELNPELSAEEVALLAEKTQKEGSKNKYYTSQEASNVEHTTEVMAGLTNAENPSMANLVMVGVKDQDVLNWDDLDQQSRTNLIELGIKTEQEYKDLLSQYGEDISLITEDLRKRAYSQFKTNILKKNVEEGINTEQSAELSNLKESYNTLSIDKLESKIKELKEKYNYSDEMLESYFPIEDIEKYKTLLKQLGLETSNTFKEVTVDVATAQSQIFQNLVTEFGKNSNIGKAFEGITKYVQDSNLPSEITNALLTIDPTLLDDGTKENAKKTLMALFNDAIENGEIGKEAAKEFVNGYLSELEKSNLIDFSITSVSGIDQIKEQLSEKYKGLIENYKTAIDTINSNITNGFIDYLDKDKIEQAIKDLDLDPSDFIYTDKQGNYQVDTEALNQAVQQQMTDEEKITKEIEEQIKEGIKQIEQKEDIIRAIINQANANKGLLKQERAITKEYALQNELKNNTDSSKSFQDIQKQFNIEWTEDATSLNVNDDTILKLEKELEALKTKRESLQKSLTDKDYIQALVEQEKAAQNKINQIYKTHTEAVEDFEKSKKKAYEDWIDKTEAVEEAQKSLAKAIETVTEKQKELANVIKGTDWKTSLDGMYNYDTALDALTKKTERAKKELDKSMDEASAKRNAQIYGQGLLDQKANIQAQIQTYQKAIQNYNKTYRDKLGPELNKWEEQSGTKFDPTKYASYNSKTGRYQINMDQLQKDQLPKEVKSWVDQYIKTVNEYQGKVEDLQDKEKELDEEWLNWKKQVRDDYIDLQQKMMDVLREKYQQEIDDLQNKYDAMEEADSKYLEALQKNIDKQRKLRDQENSWRELTDKERKLSLMQRDTSRGNAAEVKSLEKEVENDRTQLLDNAVDNIIEKLQEFYDLQKENRDAEIEYKQTLLEDVNLLKEVTEELKKIHTSEDLVNWWKDNVSNISQMSEEEFNREKEEWSNLITAKVNYSTSVDETITQSIETSEQKLRDVADETQQVVETTSEQITTIAETTLKEAGEEYKKAIKAAKDALQDAVDAVDKQKKALQSAIDAANEAKKAFDDIHDKYIEYMNSQKKAETKTVYMVDGKAYDNLQQAQRVAAQNAQHRSGSTTVSQQNVSQNTTTQSNTPPSATNTFNNNWTSSNKKKVKVDYYTSENGTIYTKEQYNNIPSQAGIKSGLKQIEVELPTGVDHGVLKYNDKDKKWELEQKETSKNMGEVYIRNLSEDKDRKKYLAFAQGGLVDYTGPAWVDGSRSRPEAFLSAEDTRRIGEAARILADLPILSQPVNKDTITNNTVGDTNIQIEVNVDQIASDYDVDEAVNRVEQKIVEAAKYAGSNVILKKR